MPVAAAMMHWMPRSTIAEAAEQIRNSQKTKTTKFRIKPGRPRRSVQCPGEKAN
jgi:hypothetical protein